MKKHILSLAVASLFFTLTVKAQSPDWVKMMRNPNVNVHDVQKAFYASHDSDITEPSTGAEEEDGIAAFKRWEWMMQARTFPTGTRPDPITIANQYQSFLHTRNMHKSSHPLSSTATWTYVGNTSVPPNIPSDGNNGGDGRVSHVRYYPGNTNIMYACCPTGGLWKTTNGGTSWSTNTDNLGDIATSDIAINPLKPNVMYLATGDGDGINSIYTTVTTIGVLKSTDGGTTWNATGLSYTLASSGPSYATINNIFVNPTDTSIVVAATSFGMYYSSNSGATWTQEVNEDFMSLCYEPSHPSMVYASTFDGKFYRSTNGGKTWANVTTGLPTSGVGRFAVAVTAADTNYVYVLTTDNTNYAFYGLYRSTNHGASFSTMSTLSGGAPNVLGRSQTGNDPTVGQGWYDLSMDVSPTNSDSVIVGGINMWASGDGGATWTLNAEWTGSGAPYVHADVHSIEFVPGQGGAIVATCDGGVFKTTDWGNSWNDLSNNLAIAQQYSVGPSRQTAGTFITGWQDNGTNLCTTGTWTQNVGGDGMVAFIDNTTDNNMYAENPQGQMVRSTNAGANWSTATSGMTETGPWVTQWMQDPKSGASSTLFAGLNNVWKSTNKGASWSKISTWSSASITALAVDSSNDNYIYAAQAGLLEYTTNGGTSWTNITGSLPVGSASITAITVNPKKPGHIWVTFSGYVSGDKVYQTYNFGTTWTNISTGLPNLPVNAICYQPGTLEALYVGTDQGVYYHDTINGWVSYNTGLPNVMIGDVKVAMVNKKLYAATYGRGTWESDLFVASAAPVAYFDGSPLSVCVGGTVQFTDTSTNSPTSWSWTFTGGTPGTSASQNPLITYNTAGTYAVKLKVTNGTGSDSLTKVAYITVNANPTVTVTPSSATACAGTGTSLTASGASTYSWSPSTGLSATTGATVTATPPSTTTYTVTGTSAAGCTGTQTVTITITPLPTITVTPSSASVCAGSGTGLTASGATTYTWAPASGLSATTGAGVTATPASTTTYTVTGTTGSCSNTQTVTVTVNALPSITVTPSSASVCSGVGASLTASGATTYSWSPATGLSATTGASVTATPVSTTTYTVTGTTGSCSNTQTVTVTIAATPTVTVAPPSATVCSGTPTGLTASGATTYTWSPSTGLSATTGATVTATPGSTTTYTVTGTSGSCSSTQSVAITVNTTPTVTVTPSSASVCSGVGTSLTSSGATTYTWSPSTGLSATTGATVTANPVSTTTYTVTGTTGSCNSTQTVTITVGTAPTVIVTPPSASVCSGTPTGLTASGATTYKWSPATGLSATTGASVTATPATTTTYTVVGTSGSCTDTQMVAITVTPTPTVTVTPSSATVCSGTGTGLTASGATTYTWAPATGLSATTGASVTATPASTTTYTITGTTGSCTSTQTVKVTVSASPTVTVTPPSSTLCSGSNMGLTASGATTYSWSPATGLSTTTGAGVTATPATTTTYTVTGVKGGCSDTQSVVITVNPTPTVTVTPPSATMCSGGSPVSLTASGATTYSWSPATGLSATTGAAVTASPATTKTYTVTGTNGTCNATKTVVVTVSATPTVTVNHPIDSICSGNNIGLTAAGATTYAWSPSTGLSATTGATVTASPATTTTYTVTGTKVGCTDAVTSVIKVNPSPTVTIAPASLTICKGTGSLVTASGATTYTWAPAAGLSATTGTSVTASPSVTTTYTVTGNNGTCTATQTIVVTVSAPPVVKISPVSATICSGAGINLTASGATTYSWFPSTGLSSTTAATTNASPAATTTYWVTGTKNGCVDSQSVVVTVNPTPTITVVPPSDSVCSGSSVNLTASGGTTYTWSPATGLGSTTGATVSAKPAATTTYTVTGTSGSCNATIPVTVIVKPLPTLTMTPTSAKLCIGSSVTLGASGATTYSWAPAKGLNTTTGSIVMDSGKTTTTYTVTGTGANGCSANKTVVVTATAPPVVTVAPPTDTICTGSKATLKASGASTYTWSPAAGLSATNLASVTASPGSTTTYSVIGNTGGCVDTVKVPVIVVPAITPVITGNDSICKGSSTVLTATGGTSYVWNTGATTASITVSPALGTTTYSVVVSNAYCNAATKTTVLVSAVTVPAITQSGDTLKCTPTGLPSYQWYLNGTAIAGATYDSLHMSKIGNYMVIVRNASGCSDSDSIAVTTLVGINEISLNQFINLYPNPTTGDIQISCNIPAGDYAVKITDVLGQVIYSDDIHTTGVYTKHIDMANYANGMYIFSLKGNNSTAEKKILITH